MKPLWTPSQARIDGSQMSRFMAFSRQHHGAPDGDYADFYRWSVDHKEAFWPAVWAYCGVKATTPWRKVFAPGAEFLKARWFEGAELNFAENLLRHCATQPGQPALIFWGEDQVRRELSYGQLGAQVAAVAGALRTMGVQPGDRVAAFMPNLPETIVAMLATASLGGVWSSCSPDFGRNGVLDRFGQIEPKVLFVADGYFYKGKIIDSLARVREIAAALPSLQRVVVVPYVSMAPDLTGLPAALTLADFAAQGAGKSLRFVPQPFNHPLYIMYSSGTTGVPKCIVHGAGGTLLQHLKEHVLHTDIGPSDRLLYFTTCGWMMWNWLVSGLASGATLMLYDGSPFHPKPDTLLNFAAQEGITVFGTSAKYLAAAEKEGVVPRKTHSIPKLRAILSTGSPLAPESFDYVYRDWKDDLQLASISGGTDIISCFALGNPILPVYRGELQCRGLGMQVEIYNESGQAVRGEKGELVCAAPFPSMPVFFWNDPGDEKYRAAYFSRFPGVWAHGDYAELTEHDGLIIYGRSDAVLNPGGVRIGTAEIYRQVEKLDEILECIAAGQEWDNDVRVVLFVKLRDNVVLDDALRTKIKKLIRDNTTPRHVPDKILAVPDIPRTISGKIVELAVTNVIHGRPVKNTDALANPDALRHFANRPELSS